MLGLDMMGLDMMEKCVMPDHVSLPSCRPLIRQASLLFAVLALTVGFGGAAFANGGAPNPAAEVGQASEPPMDPVAEAAGHYNQAIQYRERAAKLEAEIPTIENDAKRAKAKKKLNKTYRNAESQLRSAVRLNPRFHEAFSDLGFALRKQGELDDALKAYDTALSLSPNYPNAIEYRGEAFLGLGRVEDAKEAYMQLFANNREMADQLLQAMKGWVEAHKDNPTGTDTATVEALAEWVASRDQVARQVAPLQEQQAHLWGR
jgi:tetratricopeptide (TPR) repeat protein